MYERQSDQIENETARNFERMHISRTLDIFKRNFSKRIPRIIEQHLSKLRVEVMLMINQMDLDKMREMSTNLEDYIFDFEEDFQELLDQHIIDIKNQLTSIRKPTQSETDTDSKLSDS